MFTCKKEQSISEQEWGYQYFPLIKGHWITYEVDSTVYTSINSIVDTQYFNYQIKEVVGSEYKDNSGNINYKIERYFRENDSAAWRLKDIWISFKDEFKATKTEENVKFIKLTFPVKENNKWDGNAYNTMSVQEYKYRNVNKQGVVDGLFFNSCCDVLQEDLITLISENYSIERYAVNVGMIYKYYRNVEKELNQGLKSGIEYSYKLIDYGN